MKRNRFDCWSGFVAMLARRSGEANVRYPTEGPCLAPVYSTGYCESAEFLFRTPGRVNSSRFLGDFSVLACGAQGTPNRAVWRADKCRRKASQQQNTSVNLR